MHSGADECSRCGSYQCEGCWPEREAAPEDPEKSGLPSFAHPFGRCSVEPCQSWATSRWRVSVGAEPPHDRGVQEQAARLNRLGVPLCDACGVHLGAERL